MRALSCPCALALALSLAMSATPQAAAVDRGSGGRGQQQSPAEAAAALDAAAQASFDGGDYRAAAKQWKRALERLPERQASHLKRQEMLENLVISQRQVFQAEGDREALVAGRAAVWAYLDRCKLAYGTRCSAMPATAEVKTLLAGLNEAIDAAEAARPARVPPEQGVAVGGKELARGQGTPLPVRVIPSLVGGTIVAAGGAALIIFGATDARFQPTDAAVARLSGGKPIATATEAEEETTTTTGLGLSAEAKGKLWVGLGASALAIGVGFVVIGVIDLAKHRRLNRRERERVAAAPLFGPHSAGLALSGRF
jgi:hypothetical protein